MARGTTFRLNPKTFLDQVSSMGFKERGKYITLLCYMQKHGKIREAEIRAIVGEFPGDVRSKFKVDVNGYWQKKRLKEKNLPAAKAAVQRQGELFEREVIAKPVREKFTPPSFEEVKVCFVNRQLEG